MHACMLVTAAPHMLQHAISSSIAALQGLAPVCVNLFPHLLLYVSILFVFTCAQRLHSRSRSTLLLLQAARTWSLPPATTRASAHGCPGMLTPLAACVHACSHVMLFITGSCERTRQTRRPWPPSPTASHWDTAGALKVLHASSCSLFLVLLYSHAARRSWVYCDPARCAD